MGHNGRSFRRGTQSSSLVCPRPPGFWVSASSADHANAGMSACRRGAHLTARAAHLTAYGHAARAALRVHRIRARCCACCCQRRSACRSAAKLDWMAIRPWIAKPSAIQAGHYRELVGNLETLHGNIAPHRLRRVGGRSTSPHCELRSVGHMPRPRTVVCPAFRDCSSSAPPESGSDGLSWLERRWRPSTAQRPV